MTILTDEVDVDWLPKPNRVSFLLTPDLPPDGALAGAYVFAFDADRLLMVHHADRGWDLPGLDGPVAAPLTGTLARVVQSSAGVELAAQETLGYFRWTLGDDVAAQCVVIQAAQVVQVAPFQPSAVLRERTWVTPDQADDIEMLRQYAPIYQAALTRKR